MFHITILISEKPQILELNLPPMTLNRIFSDKTNSKSFEQINTKLEVVDKTFILRITGYISQSWNTSAFRRGWAQAWEM